MILRNARCNDEIHNLEILGYFLPFICRLYWLCFSVVGAKCSYFLTKSGQNFDNTSIRKLSRRALCKKLCHAETKMLMITYNYKDRR